jgi:hypothetical protein
MCLRVSFLTRCFYYVKKIQPLIRIGWSTKIGCRHQRKLCAWAEKA